jgi:FAD/FMN-containing dehydrogenase
MNAIELSPCIEVSQTELVNDMHSQLNPTVIRRRIVPQSIGDLSDAVLLAAQRGEQMSIAGGRHAMGGQQFLSSGLLLDLTQMNKVVQFDRERGLIEVQAGMIWPDLIEYLKDEQFGYDLQWTIAQKQTGCDRLSIGGALSANVHGRGLKMRPIIGDVESFKLVMADSSVVTCSRHSNRELFQLVIGGYGMFGAIATVTLRLTPRTVLRRTVEIVEAAQVIESLQKRIADGATYGDYQFAIDNKSSDFLNKGILSTYAPVGSRHGDSEEFDLANRKLLSKGEWEELLYLAHMNKTVGFEKYCNHYAATDGQLYYSDVFQLATYIDNYHDQLNSRIPSEIKGTEMITELYVPREALGTFLQNAADLLREHNADVIYGTVRLIERDDETFLPWAKQPWACIVLNLHVEHCWQSVRKNGKTFSELIQLAMQYGGSYYLTYHRFATREQLLACYPQMQKVIELKNAYDPGNVFYSDWYNSIRQLVKSER